MKMKANFALCGAVLLLLPALGSAITLTVQVKEAQMRSEPNFVSKIVANVSYKSPVEIIEEQGPWRLVKFKEQQGWIHITALTKAGLNLTAGKNVGGAISSKEVSLAGKGFNAAVEKEFKLKHRKLSFVWVDRMEKINITPPELEKFAAGSDFSTVSR